MNVLKISGLTGITYYINMDRISTYYYLVGNNVTRIVADSIYEIEGDKTSLISHLIKAVYKSNINTL